MNEIWKDIEGFEGHYQVSNLGRVRSVERTVCGGPQENMCRVLEGRIMHDYPHMRGYRVVYLRDRDVRKKAYVHRLVAIAFIPNPTNSPIVNHKNGNKTANGVRNLEWMTASENTNHYYDSVRSMEVKNEIF